VVKEVEWGNLVECSIMVNVVRCFYEIKPVKKNGDLQLDDEQVIKLIKQLSDLISALF